MKRHITNLKMGLFFALMLWASITSAQQISDTNVNLLNVGPATATVPAFDKNKAIFCPVNSFTLTASLTDISGNTFSTYEWSEVTALGGANVIAGQTTINLPVSNASPGYHTYRVYGTQDFGNNQLCRADAFEDFTVYVLPPLTVTASVPNASVLKYCVDNLPVSNPIVITATTAFTTAPNSVFGVTDLTVSDFEYKYSFFKTDLLGNKIGPALASTTANTYTITETTPGSFKYLVEVVYTVKPACVPSYNAVVTHNSTEATIIVTPKPGKPTITIN